MNRQNWDLAKIKQQETLEWAEKERYAHTAQTKKGGTQGLNSKLVLALALAVAVVLLAIGLYLNATAIAVSARGAVILAEPSGAPASTANGSDLRRMRLIQLNQAGSDSFHVYPRLIALDRDANQDRVGSGRKY